MKKKNNTGHALWKRAKKIIPGGNMLLSKRQERFLPGRWPTYFKKTKDCYVWDLDNNKYIDVCNGEMLIVDMNLNMKKYRLFEQHIKPCIFEWVYLAREESTIYGVNVYQSRVKMGEYLAEKSRKTT